MKYPFPDFVPVPSYEAMLTISIVSLFVGICLVCLGLLLLFLRKRKGKKTTIPWVCVSIGIILIANHSAQLLFNL
ncbi:putative membrane protein [Clostridium sporogenes]|uniref:Putative membrane protein n=1 Tax=Clostridium sporogenes TaxID=1509 RepID=A0A1L3NGZ5_CLOSG|nr:hypothetical protein [Clostridium sporogenes]APH15399.1 putative membrane protein [Clostridium sporogenes]